MDDSQVSTLEQGDRRKVTISLKMQSYEWNRKAIQNPSFSGAQTAYAAKNLPRQPSPGRNGSAGVGWTSTSPRGDLPKRVGQTTSTVADWKSGITSPPRVVVRSHHPDARLRASGAPLRKLGAVVEDGTGRPRFLASWPSSGWS